MAQLTDGDRREVWAEFMRELSDAREPVGIEKSALRAAVDAIDAWVNDNQASFNTAIPQPARGALTSAQKARLLLFVVRRRFLTGV
jgi:hypothetical protein